MLSFVLGRESPSFLLLWMLQFSCSASRSHSVLSACQPFCASSTELITISTFEGLKKDPAVDSYRLVVPLFMPTIVREGTRK